MRTTDVLILQEEHPENRYLKVAVSFVVCLNFAERFNPRELL